MELLTHLIKSAAILSLYYIIYKLLLTKDTFFIPKRIFLVSGIVSAFLLPFLTFEQITYEIVPIITEAQTFNFDSSLYVDFVPHETLVTASTFQIHWLQVLLVIYITGVLLMTIRFFLQLASLKKLVNAGHVKSKEEHIYIESSVHITPFSFFKYIVYNPTLHSFEELTMILAHESVHSRQWHSLDVILVHLVLIIQWFNPVAWLYKNSVEENLEFIADNAAIQEVTNSKKYQRALVRASSSLKPALTTNFYQSFIKKRIVMLNKQPSHRHHLLKLGLILPALALFMYSFNVKEVTEYVEEDNPAFAKMSTTSLIAEEPNLFIVTAQSTVEDLDQIESTIASLYPQSLVKFSNRRIAKKGIVKRFSFQTKFEGDTKFNTRFDRAKDVSEDWQGYVIKITDQQEIIVEEQGENGVSFKMDVDKIVFIDGTGIVFDRALVPANETYDETKKGTYKRATYNPPMTLQDSVYKSSTPSILASQKAIINTQNTYSFIITKDFTRGAIDLLAKKLQENHGATLNVNDVVYNDTDEIISIRLDFVDASGNSKNYSVQGQSPIADIYIYRDANGRSGMGNAISNSAMEIEQELTVMRKQMKAQRKAMMQQRDSMRVAVDVRREAMKSEMEERREEMKEEMLNRNEKMQKLNGKAEKDVPDRILNDTSDQSYPAEKATYYIDGKKVTTLEVQLVNPNDIDNISVLKGAAAIDLYGDDGKNGVVLIETKKPKKSRGQQLVVTSNPGTLILGDDSYTKITITKNSTDEELKSYKRLFDANNIDYKYYQVKRNENKEIVRIEVSLQREGNASSAKFGNGETPISDITVAYSNE